MKSFSSIGALTAAGIAAGGLMALPAVAQNNGYTGSSAGYNFNRNYATDQNFGPPGTASVQGNSSYRVGSSGQRNSGNYGSNGQNDNGQGAFASGNLGPGDAGQSSFSRTYGQGNDGQGYSGHQGNANQASSDQGPQQNFGYRGGNQGSGNNPNMQAQDNQHHFYNSGQPGPDNWQQGQMVSNVAIDEAFQAGFHRGFDAGFVGGYTSGYTNAMNAVRTNEPSSSATSSNDKNSSTGTSGTSTSSSDSTQSASGSAAANNSQSGTKLSESQVRNQLRESGYSNIRDLRQSGDNFQATADKNGRSMRVTIDAKTGAMTSTTNTSG